MFDSICMISLNLFVLVATPSGFSAFQDGPSLSNDRPFFHPQNRRGFGKQEPNARKFLEASDLDRPFPHRTANRKTAATGENKSPTNINSGNNKKTDHKGLRAHELDRPRLDYGSMKRRTVWTRV